MTAVARRYTMIKSPPLIGTPTIIAHSPAAELGETPVYCDWLKLLFWVDITGHRFFSLNPLTEKISTHAPGFLVSAVLPTTERNIFLLVSNTGILLYHLNEARIVQKLAPFPENDTRPNEAQISPDGRLFFGTMGFNAEANAGAWYRFASGEKEVHLLEKNVSIPNTLVFANNNIYFGDTVKKEVYRVAATSDNWIKDKQHVLWFEEGGADGSCLSDIDYIITARWGFSKITINDLNKGTLVQEFTVPAKQVSSCLIVSEPEYNLIYFTSARQGMITPLPDDGKLIKANTSLKALPINRFKL